jgi:hypothetical protein
MFYLFSESDYPRVAKNIDTLLKKQLNKADGRN